MENEKILSSVGFECSDNKRSGSFLVVDEDIAKMKNLNKKLEIMPLSEAVEKYPWLKNHLKSVSKNLLGYFIRVLPDSEIDYPIQTGFYMEKNKQQIIHNVLVAEPNSKVHLISGCVSSVNGEKHVGINHYFIKKNASLTLTKIHNWPDVITSFSKDNVVVGENATFISNYVGLTLGKKNKSNLVINIGKNGVAVINSIVYAKENNTLYINDKIFLNEEGARADILSRTISNGGKCFVKECISGRGKNTKGHIECDGLLLNNNGIIYSMPALEAMHSQTDLSHEAAVGKISEEELIYLMSKGIDEESAKTLIIQGFLENKIQDLPMDLQKSVENLIQRISTEGAI
ncbi:SufD family Fe-S cluster assembly protein [Lebetimonas natsushimae]|nr:SufD family Fe-S cluster assembly protein [Lebetimonas natsushimae]